MEPGKNIKTLRKQKKLTQKELAKRAGLAEITIRQYEAGRYVPKTENLFKIAAALEVPYSDLLYGREEIPGQVIQDMSAADLGKDGLMSKLSQEDMEVLQMLSLLGFEVRYDGNQIVMGEYFPEGLETVTLSFPALKHLIVTLREKSVALDEVKKAALTGYAHSFLCEEQLSGIGEKEYLLSGEYEQFISDDQKEDS